MRKLADFLKALADENRLKIIAMLSTKDLCVCEIIEKLAMSQPAISHHLKILRQAGIVKDSKEGKWIYYSLNKEVISNFEKEFKYKIDKFIQINHSKERTDSTTCEKLANIQNEPQKGGRVEL